MTETCKHQIKDKKASTWNNEVFRNCKVKAGASGYCPLHDPDNIATAEAAESQREIIAEMREESPRLRYLPGDHGRGCIPS